MGNRFYIFLVSVLLLLVAIVTIAMTFLRQYQWLPAANMERIQQIKMALIRFWRCICVGIGIRASPILVFSGASYLLLVLEEISVDVMFFLTGLSVLITVLWVFLDSRINLREIDIAFDLHDHIETLDRNNAKEIAAGLNSIKFVEPKVLGEPMDTIQIRAMINDIAREALIPSIYCDHHYREIMSYSNPMQYIKTKRDLVIEVFSLDHHEDYLQMVLNRLPPHVSFEESIESYVSHLFVDVIAPSLIRCCKTKIAYYELVMQDYKMSRSIKGKAKYFIEKNIEYIDCLQEMCNFSTIIGSAIKSRER